MTGGGGLVAAAPGTNQARTHHL